MAVHLHQAALQVLQLLGLAAVVVAAMERLEAQEAVVAQQMVELIVKMDFPLLVIQALAAVALGKTIAIKLVDQAVQVLSLLDTSFNKKVIYGSFCKT
jgi:hypothetical protein